MSPLTLFLARFLGLVFLVFSFAMMVNKRAMVAAAADLVRDRGLLLLGGLGNLAGGIAIILAHNLWSGGALTIIVTLIGWLLAVRGIVWLCAPQARLVALYEAARFERNFSVYATILCLVGLVLAVGGFSG